MLFLNKDIKSDNYILSNDFYKRKYDVIYLEIIYSYYLVY